MINDTKKLEIEFMKEYVKTKEDLRLEDLKVINFSISQLSSCLLKYTLKYMYTNSLLSVRFYLGGSRFFNINYFDNCCILL